MPFCDCFGKHVTVFILLSDYVKICVCKKKAWYLGTCFYFSPTHQMCYSLETFQIFLMMKVNAWFLGIGMPVATHIKKTESSNLSSVHVSNPFNQKYYVVFFYHFILCEPMNSIGSYYLYKLMFIVCMVTHAIKVL